MWGSRLAGSLFPRHSSSVPFLVLQLSTNCSYPSLLPTSPVSHKPLPPNLPLHICFFVPTTTNAQSHSLLTKGLLLPEQQAGLRQTHTSSAVEIPHPGLIPSSVSRKPAVVSLSYLTSSPTDHTDLPFQHSSASIPASYTCRHTLGTYLLSKPVKQATHGHHTLWTLRE